MAENPAVGEVKDDPQAGVEEKSEALFPDEDQRLADVEKQLAEEAKAREDRAKQAVADAEAKARGEPQPGAEPKAAPAAGDPAKPGGQAAPAGEPKVGDQPAAGQPATPAKAAHDPKDAAIIGLRRTVSELHRKNVVLETELKVRKEIGTAKPAGEGEPSAPAKAAPDNLEDLDRLIIDNQQAYDDGKVSPADYKREELRLMDQRQRMIAAELAPQPEPVEDTVMTDHLDRIVTDYPMLKFLTTEQLDPFFERVIQEAEARGQPYARTNRGTMQMREDMAKRATEHYMGIINAKAAASGQPAAGTQPAGGNGAKPGQLSEPAKAREAKLELAASHPPNIGNLGAGAAALPVSEGDMLRQLAALGGDEEAQMKLMESNPAFFNKVLAGVLH